MKKTILLLHFLIVTSVFGQKKFDVVFEADYQLDYKLNKASNYKKNNERKDLATFKK